MTTEKKSAKHLTTGEWVRTMGSVYVVQHVTEWGNGMVTVDLSDGQSVDCLAYAQFTLA